MNIFTNTSLKFQIEIHKMRLANKIVRDEVAEINRIAKLTGAKPKYVRLNEKNILRLYLL